MSDSTLLHRRALMSAEPLTLDKCVELGNFPFNAYLQGNYER